MLKIKNFFFVFTQKNFRCLFMCSFLLLLVCQQGQFFHRANMTTIASLDDCSKLENQKWPCQEKKDGFSLWSWKKISEYHEIVGNIKRYSKCRDTVAVLREKKTKRILGVYISQQSEDYSKVKLISKEEDKKKWSLFLFFNDDDFTKEKEEFFSISLNENDEWSLMESELPGSEWVSEFSSQLNAFKKLSISTMA